MLTEEQKKAITSILYILDEKWNRRERNIEWLRLEDVLVVILAPGGFPDTIKVKLAREAIDCVTRRGQFVGSDYINRGDYEFSATQH